MRGLRKTSRLKSIPGSIVCFMSIILQLHTAQAVTIRSITVDQDRIAANSAIQQSGIAGSAVAEAPAVRITDAFGNPVSGIDVVFGITAGGGSITGNTTVTTGPDGIASIEGWTLGAIAGVNTIEASNSGYAGSPVTFTATGTAGAAAKVVLTRESAGTASGSAFTTQPQVTIQDAEGNTVSSSQAQVTATVSTGGTLVGASTVTATNGVATFTDLGISGTAGIQYTITYSAAGLIAATQDVTVSTGAAAKLAITTQPVGGTSGSALATQPVIEVQDASGNVVTSSTATVSVAIKSGTGGTLGGTKSVTASNGVATFSGLSLAGTAGTAYTLEFTAPGLTVVTSADLTVCGAAASLMIETQPAGAQNGSSLGTQPVIQVVDASGNPVPVANVQITASLPSSKGDLTNPTATTGADGKATFVDLTYTSNFTTASTAYSIKFSVPGLTEVSSSTVNFTLATGQKYQGGYIAYLGAPYTNGLIAAPEYTDKNLLWGGYGTATLAYDQGLGFGAKNTNLIVTTLGASSNYAAGYCNNLSAEGYTDWYLPSRDELDKLYDNLKFHQIEGFADTLYWSSSEIDALNARMQYFDDYGMQSYLPKDTGFKVRAVRAF
ncbi:MAG: DUF1566 domain-containing protein [Chlorobium sp.]|uniref:Lcl domain-containing protein n=1 Tax=Chlorobium sp. TaxID=1095 RepID=UPI002F3F0DB6